MFCLGDFHFWTPLSPQGKHTHQNTPTKTLPPPDHLIHRAQANASGSDANESLPPIVEVWIAGGDFFVTREVRRVWRDEPNEFGSTDRW